MRETRYCVLRLSDRVRNLMGASVEKNDKERVDDTRDFGSESNKGSEGLCPPARFSIVPVGMGAGGLGAGASSGRGAGGRTRRPSALS